jgi:hypothetical protein
MTYTKRSEKDQARLDALLRVENPHKKFAELYQKYQAGRKWLEAQGKAGKDTKADTEEFFVKVVDPLEALLANAGPDRKVMDDIMRTFEAVNGKKIEFKEQAKLL